MRRKKNTFVSQTVVVTGGSRGIGYATARTFLERDARVAICALNQQRLHDAAASLMQLGEVEAVQADVTQYSDVEAFIEKTNKRFGRIDILVNNAGLAWEGDYSDESKESIDNIIDVNVKGVLYAARAVLPYMREAKRGVIVNVSSGAGLTGFAGLATYCTSKFGVVGFTESLAQEVERLGIRVYAVCPGRVATDMQELVSGRRIGMSPERVAEKIVALAGLNPPIRIGKCLEVY
ncbi:MAG: SDR family oxidoreductase [Acidiferrobacterales bacterium]